MRILYDFSIRVFVLAVKLAAVFSPKAQLWVQGRKGWREQLKSTLGKEWLKVNSPKPKVFWIHAASLGEFEQGRPIIEAFRERFPDWKIVLSFFSPSGYEIRKNYPLADLVCYLPADTRRNARDFLDILQPEIAIFVKYEFWGNYLLELKERQTTTLLISALFRPDQPFFKPYGAFWRRMLGCFSHIFVQNESSVLLLQSIDIHHVTKAGDTRVDRVLNLAATAAENEIVRAFVAQDNHPVLVVGSSWEADENLIFAALQTEGGWKTIIAPHEPSAANVLRICKQAKNAQRYSASHTATAANCLVIDNIGMLNTLYRYGTVAYIGGGFGKGIHNTLEPAAFGLPIVFGPKYEKFEEARQLVARGAAFPIHNASELKSVLAQLLDPVFYQKSSQAVRGYLEESRGATGAVMGYLTAKI